MTLKKLFKLLNIIPLGEVKKHSVSEHYDWKWFVWCEKQFESDFHSLVHEIGSSDNIRDMMKSKYICAVFKVGEIEIYATNDNFSKYDSSSDRNKIYYNTKTGERTSGGVNRNFIKETNK